MTELILRLSKHNRKNSDNSPAATGTPPAAGILRPSFLEFP